MKRPELSIVIGAYAEADRIDDSLKRLYKFLKKHKLQNSTEIVVVTADAPDDTVAIVAKCMSRFSIAQHITPGERAGKGRDIREGVLASKGKYIIFMDADLATPLRHILSMLVRLRAGEQIVFGVRNLQKTHDDWLRRGTSLASNMLIRLLLQTSIVDTQCGFKGFAGKDARTIFERTAMNGWGFDFEIVAIAQRHGIPVETHEIPDWHDPKSNEEGLAGQSQLHAMISAGTELTRVLLRKYTGAYDD